MEWLTIGEVAARSGVATSALRFYETKGLIESERTEGNQRRYPRATLRRVALIRAGQEVGLSLAELAEALRKLPHDKTPTKTDWQRLSHSWRSRLDSQIEELISLRDDSATASVAAAFHSSHVRSSTQETPPPALEQGPDTCSAMTQKKPSRSDWYRLFGFERTRRYQHVGDPQRVGKGEMDQLHPDRNPESNVEDAAEQHRANKQRNGQGER